MTPLQLKKPFLGIKMLESDYLKVKGMLLTPTYKQVLHSSFYQNETIIIFEIKHHLKTARQYQWLSDIKITWSKNIIVEYEYISEFYINEYIIPSGAIYSLQELTDAFKSYFIEYPKAYYPSTPKELYKKLVWYAIKLCKKSMLNIEIVYATALRFNSKFEAVERLKEKELYKKAFVAYSFVLENREKFKNKDMHQIKELKAKGGKMRGSQKRSEKLLNISRIKEVLPQHTKANGKPNITQIAKELNIRRETVSRLIKTFLTILLIIWLKCSLSLPSEINSETMLTGNTIIPIAKVTLFEKSEIKGFKEVVKS